MPTKVGQHYRSSDSCFMSWMVLQWLIASYSVTVDVLG